MLRILLFLVALPLLCGAQINKIEAKFAIDKPSSKDLMDGAIGRWKFKGDPNKKNFYEIIRKAPYKLDRYHIKYWDGDGTNPSFESNLHFSKIGNTTFINVPYFEGNFEHQGFFFLKVISISKDFSKITAVVVHDEHMWDLKENEVRQHIKANMNNAAYYRDTVHLYKIEQ